MVFWLWRMIKEFLNLFPFFELMSKGGFLLKIPEMSQSGCVEKDTQKVPENICFSGLQNTE